MYPAPSASEVLRLLLHTKIGKKRWIGVHLTCVYSLSSLLLTQRPTKLFSLEIHCIRSHCLKIPKMSHLNFSILAFSTNFCSIKTDMFGNTVWPQASGFKKTRQNEHFYELLSTQNAYVACLARNVEWEFFCDFQTHHDYIATQKSKSSQSLYDTSAREVHL